MHIRDLWQSAPTTRPAMRATIMGACIEPGPFSLKTNREGTSRNSTKQQTQTDRQSNTFGGGELISTLEGETFVEEEDTDQDTNGKTGKTNDCVQVAAADTQYHTQRTAQEYQSANHNKSAQEEAGDRSGAAFWRKFLADHCHDECAAD